MKVYLSLGSNLGDRLANLERALRLLDRGGARVLKVSRVYETAPLYYLEQPAFFNLAAACETSLSPEKLLALAGRVESALKRRRLFRNGPRTLDADILFYGGQALALPGLRVPHPRLAEREFVLAPLAEIAPGLRHPLTGLTPGRMLAALKKAGGKGQARPLPSTYTEAVAWLRELPPPAAAAHYSLAGIKAALSKLAGPEKRMGTVVHVAGSTGKTSTACLAAAALTACGFRTGLYTSPHVTGPRERIKLDGRDIPEKDFLRCLLKVESLCAGELSFFETLTAMAFLYFAENKPRFSVVEAGLGGRLDATNAARGAVAVITSISAEHTGLLGPRLADIAGHKAGIIKRGAAVVAGLAVPPEAGRVIRRRAAAVGARLFAPEAFAPGAEPPGLAAKGAFQLANAGLALKAARLAAGARFKPGAAARALAVAVPRGRFERAAFHGRRLVIDGAHNPEGLDALLREFGPRRPVCVAAFMEDKALARLAASLAAASSKLILTRSLSYRSASPAAVKRTLPPALRRGVEIVETPMKALRRAVSLAPAGGTVLVAGSLYLAGDVLAGLKNRKAFHPREMLVT